MNPARRLLVTLASIGDRLLRTTIDRHVCRWVNETDSEETP